MPSATAVYVPVGGGGLLTAIHRGYAEVSECLPIGAPRLVGVQPSGCATLERALKNEPPVVDRVTTTISGLQVAVLIDADDATAAVRESGGHAVTVEDPEIWEAQQLLARQGVLVEPAGATALAGALADVRARRLGPDDQVVAILSGAGWKDGTALGRLSGSEDVPIVTAQEIPLLLER
jgi:threonine synthase